MSSTHHHSSNAVDVQRIINKNTPFAVKEAYRSLYTNVLYLPLEEGCKKFVVTSAYPGEGKTSLSINLAITIAMNSPESRVLIIARRRATLLPRLQVCSLRQWASWSTM